MKTVHASALTMALVLAACGGGDGSTPTPTPTPTPTATASPTPTPTPAPVSYTEFDDLTDPITFQSACATQSRGPNVPFFTLSTEFGDGLTFESTPAEKKYVVKGQQIDLTFTADLITNEDAAGRSYQLDNPGTPPHFLSVYSPAVGATGTKYARFAYVGTNISDTERTLNRCVIGVTTELEDQLPNGFLKYEQLFGVSSISVVDVNGGVEYYRTATSTYFFRADPSTGEIQFKVTLRGESVSDGTERFFGSFTGTTTIDGTEKNFSGKIVNGANELVGNFGGWFFGPQGEEMAMAWSLNEQTGNGETFNVYATLIGSNP